MEDSFLQLPAGKVVVVLIWFVFLFVAERLSPASIRPVADGAEHPKARCRLWHNLGLWLINSLMWPLTVWPVTLWAVGHQLRPSIGTSGLWLLLHVLVLDLWLYWWHRANHRCSFLWRFHLVHHLDNWLDTTSGVRFHFGEVLLSAIARMTVILLLGIPMYSLLVYETLVLMCSLFHHSNIKLAAGIENCLSRLIITPGIHWVHHRALKSDIDSNYGTLFSFWDQLFATRSGTIRFGDMPIGIKGRAEPNMGRLLTLPFVAYDRGSRLFD